MESVMRLMRLCVLSVLLLAPAAALAQIDPQFVDLSARGLDATDAAVLSRVAAAAEPGTPLDEAQRGALDAVVRDLRGGDLESAVAGFGRLLTELVRSGGHFDPGTLIDYTARSAFLEGEPALLFYALRAGGIAAGQRSLDAQAAALDALGDLRDEAAQAARVEAQRDLRSRQAALSQAGSAMNAALQQAIDDHDKLLATLSNVLKVLHDAGDSTLDNLKP
jgi:hypothetical protein